MIAKKLTRALVALLLVISLSFIVSASIDVNYYSIANEFTLKTGLSELSLCQCAVYTDSITVTNIADSQATFQVSSDLGFVKVVEQAFALDKGASKTVHLQIEVPCDAKGTYELNILVQNSLGVQKTLSKNLEAGKCQNLKVDFFAPNVTAGINPCTALDFNLLISNPGVFQEQYKISVPGLNSTFISENDFFLKPQESKNVSLKTSFPCDVYGSQNIVFNVETVNSKLKVSIPFKVNILQKYDYSVLLLQEPNFCFEDGKKTVQVEVKNLVKVPNNYSLQLLDAPSFVTLSKEWITLGANEKAVLDMLVDAKKMYEGEYDFVLHSKTEVGNTYNDLPVHLRIWSCYNPKVILPVNSASLCQDTFEYPVKIRNDGRFEDTFAITYSGPSFVSLSDDSVVLGREQEAIVMLIVNAPNEDSENDIVIAATLSNGYSVSNTLHLKTFSTQSCYNVDVEKKDYRVYKDIKEIQVPIKSSGPEAGTYDVVLNNSNAPWITAADSVIELTPGQTKQLKLFVDSAGQEYGDYIIGLSLVKSLTAQDVAYQSELSVKHTDRPLYLKVWKYILQKPCMLVMGILALLFIIFLIMAVATKTKPGKKRPEKVWVPLIILTVLFILAIVFVMYKAGPLRSIYPAVPPSEDKLQIVWAEDTTYMLNLSGYFADPDKDILNYVVSDTDNITIDIKGNTAHLIPNKDWSGEELVVFSAYDNRGGVADSPVMTLTVVDMPEYSRRSKLEFYCHYINIALLFFVFLFIYIIFYKRAGTGRPTKAQREAMMAAEKANGNNKKTEKKEQNRRKKK